MSQAFLNGHGTLVTTLHREKRVGHHCPGTGLDTQQHVSAHKEERYGVYHTHHPES